MKTLFFFTTILLQFTFLVNAQTSSKDLSQVKIGMSKSQVIKLVGKPDKGGYTVVDNKKKETLLIWNYSPEQTIYFTKGKVSQIEFNKDAIRNRMKNSIQKNKTDTSKLSPEIKQFIQKQPTK